MYIIEFEKGVYATEGEGDPARTLRKVYAQTFSTKKKAEARLKIVLNEIKSFRQLPNSKVVYIDY